MHQFEFKISTACKALKIKIRRWILACPFDHEGEKWQHVASRTSWSTSPLHGVQLCLCIKSTLYVLWSVVGRVCREKKLRTLWREWQMSYKKKAVKILQKTDFSPFFFQSCSWLNKKASRGPNLPALHSSFYHIEVLNFKCGAFRVSSRCDSFKYSKSQSRFDSKAGRSTKSTAGHQKLNVADEDKLRESKKVISSLMVISIALG